FARAISHSYPARSVSWRRWPDRMPRRWFSFSRVPARAARDAEHSLMTHGPRLCLLLIVLLHAYFFVAASQPARRKPIDVAEFFREIDAELSAIDSASPALHQAIAADSRRTNTNSRAWQQQANLVQDRARNICTIARKYRLASANSGN